MSNAKKLMRVFASVLFFIFIMPIVNAYQELHEPDVVYIKYTTEGDASNMIGMYESAANTLIKSMGEACFQKTEVPGDLVKNKIYLLPNPKECNGNDTLFSKVLEFYKQALNALPNDAVAGMVTKGNYVRIKKDGEIILKYLSVEVNKKKKIITRLTI